MTKGPLRDEYESDNFKAKRKQIEEEMKKPLINLMYIYSKKKVENKNESLRTAIN